MAGDVNKVILVGRLGNDPETRQVGDTSVTSFSLATSKSWKDKGGEKNEKTEWHRINAWGKLGEICAQYLAKGRQCYVEGEINYRKYENKEGVTQYSTDIRANDVKFLGGSGGSASAPDQDPNNGAETNEEPF